MKSILLLVLIFALSYSNHSFSAPHVAEVIKVRGDVTQLRPGSLSASRVKLGDKLIEDTSILTGKRSFIRVRFVDASVLNLGPSGKVVITQMKKKSAGIITLLKGKLRTQVVKSKKEKKNKFFIKTRTAALGVRGTEFQTIYNPDNKVTNLLTFKGKVAMVKVKKGITDLPEKVTKKTEVKEKIVERTSIDDVQVEEVAKTHTDQTQRLESLLESKEAVVVKQGQFSGVVKNLNRTTLPVQISPVQFNVLYKNKEFSEKSEKAVKKKVVKNLKTEKLALKQVKQEAPTEGVFNKKTGEFAAKSGGYIDLNTGLYVPPKKDSVFNKKLGVYEVKAVGAIDKDTGQYVAPKGLKLDAKEGFVLKDKKKATKKQKKVLLAMTTDLNKNIKKDLFVGEEEDVKEVVKLFSSREIFAKNNISLSLTSIEQKLDQDKNNYEGIRFFRDGEAKGFSLNWDHSSDGSWQPVTRIDYKRVELKQNTDFSQISESLLTMSVGFRKYLTSRWNLLTLASIDQMLFVNYVNESSTINKYLTKVALPKLSIFLEGDLIKSGSLSFDTKLGLMASLSKDAAALNVHEGFGFHIEFGAKYWATQNSWMRLSLFGDNMTHDTKSAVAEVTDTHKTSGLSATFGYLF